MDKIQMINKIIGLGLIVVALICSGHSDSYIRSRVVHVLGEKMTCTGAQVRAPSGKDYILTAGHCRRAVLPFGLVMVTPEGDTDPVITKVVAEDPSSDLLLLEGLPKLQGLKIAKAVHRFDKVRLFSHGHGFATHTSAGEYVQETLLEPVHDFTIDGGADFNFCVNAPKFVIVKEKNGSHSCSIHVPVSVSTAWGVHGSSGGPIVNRMGDVVGIFSVFREAENFAFSVRLADIQNFLSNY